MTTPSALLRRVAARLAAADQPPEINRALFEIEPNWSAGTSLADPIMTTLLTPWLVPHDGLDRVAVSACDADLATALARVGEFERVAFCADIGEFAAPSGALAAACSAPTATRWGVGSR